MRCVLHILLSRFHVRAYIIEPWSKYKSLYGNVTNQLHMPYIFFKLFRIENDSPYFCVVSVNVYVEPFKAISAS